MKKEIEQLLMSEHLRKPIHSNFPLKNSSFKACSIINNENTKTIIIKCHFLQ